MDYSGAFATHPTMYAPNFGNPSAERLQQHYQQQHYDRLTQASMPDQSMNPYATAAAQHQIACDIKPRLTKEQHDILEAHYTEQTKPNTSTKKGFAESLNVSLDKVNNWFQNRRAKSKQDVKKAQSAQQALSNSHQAPSQLSSSGSDSEASPAFAPPDYYNMMQQCSTEKMNDGLTGSARSQFDKGMSTPDLQFATSQPDDQFSTFDFDQTSNDQFDSPQDLNRRTLTQDQFNDMQQSILQGSGSGDYSLDMGADTFENMLPDFTQQNTTAPQNYGFAGLTGLAMSNAETSMPPPAGGHSAMGFPSSGMVQDRSVSSSASSDWGGSRSSSVSTYSRDGHSTQPIVAPQPQPASTTSQWRPGQSVPVDFNQLSQEFKQIAQSRHTQPQYNQEQPLAWPVDEAYRERSNSQTAGMIQSMSNVGLKTPQPQQHAAFKSPTPSTSLATRRQRTKPAPLGLASLRSQSYSAASQPGSPGTAPHHQQQHHASQGVSQPLRRIKSSNMVNGVAQGRIQKPTPGSAQRSPLNWTFADVMNSPKGLRHVSSQTGSSLAPPTPMSPREQARVDAARQFQQWQSVSGQISRQASISENDIEQQLPYVPTTSGLPENVSSPPHTPLYPPQPQFAAQRAGKNIITENTPPQSAPATQVSFTGGSFVPAPPPPSHALQHQPVAMSQPPPPQQAMQHMFAANPPQVAAPEPQFPMGGMSVPQQPQFTITASDPMSQLHFPYGGVPMVDANGNLQMAMPQPHYQLVSHPPPIPCASAPPLSHTPPIHFPFPATDHSPGHQIQAHAHKAAPQPELFVHEYQPPADVKRAATPRKVPAESGPKNYTFANQTPEHFEKGKKATAVNASHSPASNSS